MFDVEKNILACVYGKIVPYSLQCVLPFVTSYCQETFFHQHIPCLIEAYSYFEIGDLAWCSFGDLSTHVVKKKVHLLS